MFSAIALVYIAHILCYRCSCRHTCAELMALADVSLLGLSVGSFYFTLLEAGTNYKGIKVIIPLAPSIVLSLIAWFIRKKITSQEKDETSRMKMVMDYRDHDERMEGKSSLLSETKSVGSDLV